MRDKAKYVFVIQNGILKWSCLHKNAYLKGFRKFEYRKTKGCYKQVKFSLNIWKCWRLILFGGCLENLKIIMEVEQYLIIKISIWKKMRLLYSCRRNMFGGCLENMKMIMEAEQYLIITKIFIWRKKMSCNMFGGWLGSLTGEYQ